MTECQLPWILAAILLGILAATIEQYWRDYKEWKKEKQQ